MISNKTGIGFFLLVLFCFILDHNIRAQTLIQGIIFKEHEQPAQYINVVVKPFDSSIITAFGFSDRDGRFAITVNHAADSLDIIASSLHYSRQIKRVKNVSQELLFYLQPDVKLLETFTVRASPIEHKSDTISYLVQSFASQSDRNIEDVLRRMPGIEVESGGRILYQGLPIQKFYVEGLDLMDGRYVAISSNMPHTVVSTVEVLENHQPLRILEDRVSTQQPSLNIKLKKNITTTGKAQLGTGYGTSLAWEANITPMTFTKEFQLLGSYQANNTGEDVAQQLRAVGFQDMLLHPEKPAQDVALLKIQRPNLPPTEQNRFLFNKIHLLNLNGLLRIKHNLQLRTNLHYVNDYQQQRAITKRRVYAPNDTLAFTETLENRYHDHFLRAVFTISRNVKDNYLSNKLSIESGWSSQKGLLYDGYKNIKQTLEKPVFSVYNDFRTVHPLGSKLVEFLSYVTYDENNHTLLVSPGVFESAINDHIAYDSARQQVMIKRLYAHHSASFMFRFKRLTFSPALGLVNRYQDLESGILVSMNGNVNPAGSDFSNQIQFSLFRPYAKTGIEFKSKGLTIKTDLPLSYNRLVAIDATNRSQHVGLNNLFFEPRLSIHYQFKGFCQISGSYFHTNRLGNIDDVHYSFIIKTYNMLFQNPLQQDITKNSNISLRLSYRNPITAFFNSIIYIKGIRVHSVMYSTSLLPDGKSEIVTLNIPNKGTYHNVQLNSSRYISFSRSTLSLKASYVRNKRQSLLNDETFYVENSLLHLSPQLNTRITSRLNCEYRFEMNQLKTKTGNTRNHLIDLTKHHFNLYAFPRSNMMLSFMNELYTIDQKTSMFSDISYRHSFKSKGLDLELQWSNIFNTKTYTDYQTSVYIFYESIYYLRPAQLLISLKMSF